MIAIELIFWCSVILLFHSYIFYPLLLQLFSRNRSQNKVTYDLNEELPDVSILLAVYNEEEVIEKKIISTFNTSYPIDKIEFLIGSDQSTDRSEEIILKYSERFPKLKLIRFYQRSGKVNIMNRLAELSRGQILLLTDANVFFSETVIYELVKHFKQQPVALVGANILNPNLKTDGISFQESSYLFMENHIKYLEGILWGGMMGAFGGCYAIRKDYFIPVPDKFIVDDFYITMSVLEQRGKALAELNAVCYEDVSNRIAEEFRRKSRIATGNFQIIGRFNKLLSPSKGGIAFAFWSHKVLRWMGPFFIIGAYLSNFALSFSNTFYNLCFWIQCILLLIPILDSVLRKLKVHFFGLRYITHFYVMNLALLNGFFKFIGGVKNNVWTPTQRNQ
ncbi:MAG: glycosyltransferase [Chitinophagales bacterium]|nr:glycosyltransferase [Chitinophagales bacterium]